MSNPAPLKAIPKRASRTMPPKLDVAKAAEPQVTRIVVKKTRTAHISGCLGTIQQAQGILTNARSFGEALDTLNRLEAQARGELLAAVGDELKGRRIKTDGMGIGTESTPEGINILLTKTPV